MNVKCGWAHYMCWMLNCQENMTENENCTVPFVAFFLKEDTVQCDLLIEAPAMRDVPDVKGDSLNL